MVMSLIHHAFTYFGHVQSIVFNMGVSRMIIYFSHLMWSLLILTVQRIRKQSMCPR